MIGFRMQQIKVEQFAILSETVPTEFNIENHISVGVDSVNRTIAMRLRVNYYLDKNILLTLTIVCSFAINAESWQQLISENKVVIPRGFIVHMAVHTLGTARGVLFVKSEGSDWQNKILPPTNVDEMFKNDIVIKL